MDLAIAGAKRPDHGIWELRSKPAHHLHSKLMSWVALDRALKLAPHFGGDRDQERWHVARGALEREILQRGYREESGTFTGTFGEDTVDATLLLLPIHGLLPANDPRMARTLDRVVRELSDGPFLHRYRGDDGIGCDEGAFLLCGFWLAEALALSGRLDDALAVMHEHTDGTTKPAGVPCRSW